MKPTLPSDNMRFFSANFDATTNLSLVAWWQDLLTSALPLLADAGGVSLIQARIILRPLLIAVGYRVAELAANQPEYLINLFKISYDKSHYYLNPQSGLTFANFTQLQQNAEDLSTYLYTEPNVWYALLGTLVAPTQLSLADLDKLAKLIVSLALVTLSWLWRDNQNTVSSVTTAQLIEWLKQQPIYLHHANADSATLLVGRTLAGYQSTISLSAEQQLSQHLIKHGLAGWQQSLIDQMQAYLAKQPLAIVSKPVGKKISAYKHHPSANTSRKTADRSALTHDIFAKKSKKSNRKITTLIPLHRDNLSTRLQRHWIATALSLSALVFGGLAWAWSAFVPKPAAKSASVVASAPTTAAYQDVAIVRVASTVSAAADAGQNQPLASAASPTKSEQTENNQSSKEDKTNVKILDQKKPAKALPNKKPPSTNDKNSTTKDKNVRPSNGKTDKPSKEKDKAKNSQTTAKKVTDNQLKNKTADNKQSDKAADKKSSDKTTKSKKSDQKTSKDRATEDSNAT